MNNKKQRKYPVRDKMLVEKTDLIMNNKKNEQKISR
jgi:hypothetical protein